MTHEQAQEVAALMADVSALLADEAIAVELLGEPLLSPLQRAQVANSLEAIRRRLSAHADYFLHEAACATIH